MTTNKRPLIFAGLAILVFVVGLVGITQSYPGRELLALFTGFGEEHWDTLDNCREAAFAVGLSWERVDTLELKVRGLAAAVRFLIDRSLSFLFIGGIVVVAGLVYRWLYLDAESRGKNGCLILLLCVFLGWIGWLLWLVFRPGKVETEEED